MRNLPLLLTALALGSAVSAQEDPIPERADHLVLTHHGVRDGEVGALHVDLRGERPTWKEPTTVPALRFHRAGLYRAVLAHGGGASWATAAPPEGGDATLRFHAGGAVAEYRLQRRGPTGEADRVVSLRCKTPSALALIGDLAVVGAGNQVVTVDFAAPDPVAQVVREREGMRRGKAYDLFARRGDWLIAIDDVVSPIYADGFRVTRGGLEHEQDLRLPDSINGRYAVAALRATKPRDGTLFAVVPYGIMDGNGHDLVALRFRAGKIVSRVDVVLQNASGGDPPVLSEHVSRVRADEPPRLVAGDAYTGWSGLVVVDGEEGARLLVSAGERGMLVLPAGFDASTRAQARDLGGPCLHVRERAGRVWALVGGDAPALIELDPKTLAERWRVKLPRAYTRIL
jgi:hypothetical protein